MTKEERAEMLALMHEAIQPISNRLDKLEQGQNQIQSDISALKSGQSQLEQGQRNTDIIIENEVDRAIKTIGEGHTILNRKLDETRSLANRIETLEHKVSALEYAVNKAE